MPKTTLLLCLLSSAGVIAGSAQAQAPEGLPTDVTPRHYDLAIRPDLDALTFSGTNAITIDVKAPTREITLNAEGLAFDRVLLDHRAVGTTSYDAKLGRATLRFAAPVAAGTHTLTIDYHSKLGQSTLGLFAMDYDTPQGKRRTLATNLEPAGARQVFPGWDEPALKASYTVTVDAARDRMAISNMPVARTVAISPTVNRVTFAESPRMSSYLFFLGMGDWERIHQQIDGVDVGVVVNRGDTAKGRYALAEAARLLHYYNGYFGTPYPLPKMDLIAAPGQIEGGSMENWGAIFYSQNHLLFDPQHSTEADRQEVFLVVSHEMAHQWFGDLVTMRWWDNLWLNEGFARWMQTYAADALHPEWKTGLQARAIFEAGKSADALPSTHPIVQPILTVNQAAQAFDNITYDKGAAVISMLVNYTGEDAFRTGVQRYMKAHAFGNTVDADLWSVMQQVTGRPILEIEHDFTAQEGLPLIRVSPGAPGLHLQQDRFYAAGPVTGGPAQRWLIPVAVGGQRKPGESLLLRGAADVPGGPTTLVNEGQKAYARVLYAQPHFDALLAKVPAMAAVDQIGMLHDARALGMAGYAPGSNMLALAARVPADADPIVWQQIAATLRGLDARYPEGPGRAAFRRYAAGLVMPALAALGTAARAGESASAQTTRAELTEALGEFGDPATVARARALVQSGGGSPDEAQTALNIAAAKADPALFDMLLARARATQDPLEKMRLYQALAGAEDPALAGRFAQIVMADALPAGTFPSTAGRFAGAHPDLAWSTIVPFLGTPKAGVEKTTQWRMAAFIAGLSPDTARVAQFQTYLDANVPADAGTPFKGVPEQIRTRHRVVTQVLPEIDAWIARQGR